MIGEILTGKAKDVRNTFFYTTFIIRKKVFSRTFLFLLLGITILFVGMAAVFDFAFSSFSTEFNTASRFLGYEFSYQISIAATATTAIFLAISFISSEIIDQKTTRSIELIMTSIKPSSTMYSIIFAYLSILLFVGLWALGNIFLAKHFFHNYFLDSISLFPRDISFRNYIIGIGILANHYPAPDNAISPGSGSSLITWDPSYQAFGWYLNGAFDTNGVPPFSPLQAFSANASQLFSEGLRLLILLICHYVIIIFLFAYIGALISSMISSAQELQYALFPIYTIIGIPLALYPFLRNQSESLLETFSYIPGLNTSFFPSLITDNELSNLDKWFVLIPEGGLLLILALLGPSIYKVGVLNNSKSQFYKDIFNVLKLSFTKNVSYLRLKKIKEEEKYSISRDHNIVHQSTTNNLQPKSKTNNKNGNELF